jgi:FKBP-type peptidyl-prolyl cis-trans isomerase FkpA
MAYAKIFLLLGIFASATFGSSISALAAETAPAPVAKKPVVKKKFKIVPVKDLTTTDTVVGTGAEAATDKVVTIHFTGWIYSYFKPEHKGTEFESSVGHSPYTFKLGAENVIKGWNEGIVGMKVGGKRTLIVPPDMGFGERRPGRGAVPPNSPLVFDIELLGVK